MTSGEVNDDAPVLNEGVISEIENPKRASRARRGSRRENMASRFRKQQKKKELVNLFRSRRPKNLPDRGLLYRSNKFADTKKRRQKTNQDVLAVGEAVLERISKIDVSGSENRNNG